MGTGSGGKGRNQTRGANISTGPILVPLYFKIYRPKLSPMELAYKSKEVSIELFRKFKVVRIGLVLSASISA